MSHPTIQINEFIHLILKDHQFDHFTVTELREKYIEVSKTESKPEQVRQFVYRQVDQLVKNKLLKKKSDPSVRLAQFSKTESFLKTTFKAKKVTNRNKKSTGGASPKVKTDLSNIKEQLQQYEVDLLSSVGESEEYMRLYTTNPELKTMLEKQYLQARDQSSRLLGQIKALNTVLHQCAV